MRKTALILAGAIAFDLGVVVLAAQAQQTREPTRGPAVGTGPAPGQTPPNVPAEPGPPRGPVFPKIARVDAIPACGPGESGPCRADDPRPSAALAGADDAVFIKIDRLNTVRACVMRRGEVVRREGVDQCRVPTPRLEDGNSALQEVSTTR